MRVKALGQKMKKETNERGSIEIIVIGLLAALVIVLAIPLLKDTGSKTASSLSSMNAIY